jgi:hypothetical protein
MAEHAGRFNIQAITGLENLTRADARAAEQMLIDYYGLGNLQNKINSIAVSRDIYLGAVQRGWYLIRQAGHF